MLDPALAEGIPESNVLVRLYEGLVRADGASLEPKPGVADELGHFARPDDVHLPPAAGRPVEQRRAADRARFRRQLPAARSLAQAGGLLSYYLFPLKNAEAYNKGKLTDFEQVGAHAVDDHTLRLDLEHPTPYLLRLLLQRYYFPVYLPGVEKTGGDRRTVATRSGPGPKISSATGLTSLTEWTPNQRIVARKNPHYWNRDHLRINEVRYYPIEDASVEESAFRAGLIHKTSSGNNLPMAKLDVYQREKSSLLHVDPYMGSYYYMLNTTKPAAQRRARAARPGDEH